METEEDLTKAKITLLKVKMREVEQRMIPVKVARNTTIMMPANSTREEIQSKINQYKNK